MGGIGNLPAHKRKFGEGELAFQNGKGKLGPKETRQQPIGNTYGEEARTKEMIERERKYKDTAAHKKKGACTRVKSQ